MAVETRTPSIEPANPADAGQIANVLRACRLPHDAIEQHISGFLVARDGAELLGCVAQERYGTTSILRSLAVAPEFRGRSLGLKLAQAILDRAKQDGVGTMVLLTETAEQFFAAKLGFEVVDRSEVSPEARESWQFTGAVCQSATCMMKALA